MKTIPDISLIGTMVVCIILYVDELDAAIRGDSLALKWELSEITVLSDCATVFSWLKPALRGDRRVKVSGMWEMSVHPRLGPFKELTEERNLNIQVMLVGSRANIEDARTRVEQRWLRNDRKPPKCEIVCNLKEVHN